MSHDRNENGPACVPARPFLRDESRGHLLLTARRRAPRTLTSASAPAAFARDLARRTSAWRSWRLSCAISSSVVSVRVARAFVAVEFGGSSVEVAIVSDRDDAVILVSVLSAVGTRQRADPHRESPNELGWQHRASTGNAGESVDAAVALTDEKGGRSPRAQSSFGSMSVSTGAGVSPGPMCSLSSCVRAAMMTRKRI